MANNIVPFNKAALPAAFAGMIDDPELNQELVGGIQASFPVLSFRGKIWRIVSKGVETPLMNPQTGDPVASINVILLRGSKHINKIYFPTAYEEGSDQAPDCFSNDGIRPDPQAESPQAEFCASCPKNVWGSKITPQGSKTKACADSKRFAVASPNDPSNALLLRVPPASLAELASYGEVLRANGAQFFTVVTKISFDIGVAYPKLKFSFVSQITGPEIAQQVVAARDSELVRQIMQEPEGVQPPVEHTLIQKPATVQPPKAVSVAPQAPAVEQGEEEEDNTGGVAAVDDLIAQSLAVPPTVAAASSVKGTKRGRKPAAPAPAEAPAAPPAPQQEVVVTSKSLDDHVGSFLSFR